MCASTYPPARYWSLRGLSSGPALRLLEQFARAYTRRVIELLLLTPNDWSVWRSLRLTALAESPNAFGSRLTDWLGDGDSEDRWRARLSIPGARNVVAKLGGEPAGMASGVPLPVVAGARPLHEAGDIELISMWVAPSARGHGVADALVQDLVAWAANRGSLAVWLSVRETNAPAIARSYCSENRSDPACSRRPRSVKGTRGQSFPIEPETPSAAEGMCARRSGQRSPSRANVNSSPARPLVPRPRESQCAAWGGHPPGARTYPPPSRCSNPERLNLGARLCWAFTRLG